MNLFSYIDKYGCYDFGEVTFNEVDNVIFSMISYLELDGIVSRNRYNPKRLKNVGEEYFSNYDKSEKKFITIRRAIKILKAIMVTRRYKDLLLYNYIYEVSGENQFGALTIEINKKLVYVSFEGTDQLIGGWKEDFMLSYMFPVLSQKKAIDYLNKNFWFRRKHIIIGGHSKGGNLAIVAGMYANIFVKDRIEAIYNNDGPGVLEEQFNSKQYKSIESKLITIIPDYSVIGLLLCHGGKRECVRAFRKNVASHEVITWVVRDNKFERSELSNFSSLFEKEIRNWLNSYDNNEKEKFVDSLFNIFERVDVDSLLDLFQDKKLVFKIIGEAKDIDEASLKMIRSFFKLIFKCIANGTKDEVISFLEKKGNNEKGEK